MSVVSLVLAPWFVSVHGIEVQQQTAAVIDSLLKALFG
jgi:hypothetical protein